MGKKKKKNKKTEVIFMPKTAYIHSVVYCPDCHGYMVMTTKETNFHICCLNPDCNLYEILFERPQITLKPIR